MSNIASAVDDILRPLGLWAADCAEVALPIFEAHAPGDVRPRDAVTGIRAFGRGGPRSGRLRSLAWAAHKAGHDVNDPAATSSARAASLAAASAYLHLDVHTPHQTRHGLGPAVYAAQALEQSAAGDTRSATTPSGEQLTARTRR
jgi:hypothetical protein